MKFKIEVDLDWIGEEGNVNDEVKAQIISGICSKINKKSQEDIRIEIEKQISENVDAVISGKINETVEEFLNKDIKILDNYGDLKDELKITELLKKRFDMFMIERVDDSGKPSSYSSKSTRAEWIIEKRVESYCKKRTEEMTVDVEEKIKQVFSTELEMSIKNKIISNLGLEEMMSKTKQLTNQK